MSSITLPMKKLAITVQARSGMIPEKQRPRREAVHHEGAQQNCNARKTRNTQGEQRYEGGVGVRIVRRLRSGNTLDAPCPNFSGCLEV